MRDRRFRLGAVVLAIGLIAAACGPSSDGPGLGPGSNRTGTKGGVYRVGWQEPFGFTDSFDVSGEYLGAAWDLYSNLLVRTLVGYNHVAGPEGNEPVADVAKELPEPTDDGLTYTFHIKDGIKFGPPLSREVTSKDFLYAMERIANPDVAAQYAFYYTPYIEGMQDFTDGEAKSISGIETPDDKTIVFHLTQPLGDFLLRMAMPATGPIPAEVGKCFEEAGQYGRYVWSSGPYMIDGQQDTDISSCEKIEPFSGFNPNREMDLVRNPDYDESTDSPKARENLPDEFQFIINSNAKDIYDKVANNEYEDEIATEPPQVLRKYSTDPALKPLLKIDSGDRTWYVSFDLTQPPFDDIHVRKAVNYALDKEGMQRAWGGPVAGEIATHIMPPAITGGHPTADEYNPYPYDVEKAKEEMAQSKYDTDHDGLCDADVCKDILHFTRNYDPWTAQEPVEEASLEEIGITLQERELADFYTPWQTMERTSPIASGAGWGKDYGDPSTFVATLFDSTSILPTGNTNVPLVGLTPEIAKDTGIAGLPGRVLDGIPSVDDDIDKCNEETGDARTECWIALDKKLMEEVVPWAPYLWANNNTVVAEDVTQWGYDQFPGYNAFAHVAVDQSKQEGL
jgi:peptide/nickel transport system substrate-binding protein